MYLSTKTLCAVLTVAILLFVAYAQDQNTYSLGEVHLALTHDPTQLVVQFTVTPNATEGMFSPHKVLYFQPQDNGNSREARTSMYRYNITQMCGAPANDSSLFGNPGTIHTAVLTGLVPGEPVYYAPMRLSERIGRTFTTIADYNRTRAFSFVMMGDMGTNGEASNVMKLLNQTYKHDVNLVLHVGDIAYARGKTSIWTEFMNQIQPVASKIPWMVNCGNHDCLYDTQSFNPPWAGYNWAGGDGNECAVPYNARFHMPGDPDWSVSTDSELQALRQIVRNKNLKPSVPLHSLHWSKPSQELGFAPPKNNIFYSFNQGPIHVAMISTEHDMTEDSVQYAWLDADLAKVNRTAQPFVLVGMHRPLYEVTVCGELLPETAAMRKTLEPLMLKHKVDIVLHGHYHQYERTCALANDKCVDPTQGEAGPTYLVVGTGGRRTQCPWGSIPDWSKFLSYEFGFVKMTVESPTRMIGEFIESVNGNVIDTFEVVRANV